VTLPALHHDQRHRSVRDHHGAAAGVYGGVRRRGTVGEVVAEWAQFARPSMSVLVRDGVSGPGRDAHLDHVDAWSEFAIAVPVAAYASCWPVRGPARAQEKRSYRYVSGRHGLGRYTQSFSHAVPHRLHSQGDAQDLTVRAGSHPATSFRLLASPGSLTAQPLPRSDRRQRLARDKGACLLSRVAQLAERSALTRVVGGFDSLRVNWRVVQLAERATLTRQVAGSTPATPT
jgi:hypothetical protein